MRGKNVLLTSTAARAAITRRKMTEKKNDQNNGISEEKYEDINPIAQDNQKKIEKSEAQQDMKRTGKRKFWIDKGGVVVFDPREWVDYMGSLE